MTLFASGDSVTSARLVAGCRRALRLDKHCVDQMAHHLVMLEHVFQPAAEFDVVHFHVDYLHFPLSRRQRLAHVTTLHGRLDIPDLAPLYREFRDMPVVSISDAQRTPLRTPLFVVLAGAYYERTGDVAFAASIWPHVERALAWFDQYGDRDGDGFVEYFRRSRHGLMHQGWKDSQDAVFHADGTAAQGPIALCTVARLIYVRAGATFAFSPRTRDPGIAARRDHDFRERYRHPPGVRGLCPRRIAAVLETFDPSIAWHVPGHSPLAGDYRGHDEVVGFFKHTMELAGGIFRIDVHHVLAEGEVVVALTTVNAERNGRFAAFPEVHVWRLADGKATEFREFQGDEQTEDRFWS